MMHKVMAYILRRQAGQRQLLVFEHRGLPEAGVQVPAGTVEPGEPVEAALFREIHEESGLERAQLRLVRKLCEHFEAEWQQRRHVYEVAAAETLPESWSHTVHGQGEDQGMVFDYYWVGVSPELKLAGGQERFLHLADGYAG